MIYIVRDHVGRFIIEPIKSTQTIRGAFSIPDTTNEFYGIDHSSSMKLFLDDSSCLKQLQRFDRVYYAFHYVRESASEPFLLQRKISMQQNRHGKAMCIHTFPPGVPDPEKEVVVTYVPCPGSDQASVLAFQFGEDPNARRLEELLRTVPPQVVEMFQLLHTVKYQGTAIEPKIQELMEGFQQLLAPPVPEEESS